MKNFEFDEMGIAGIVIIPENSKVKILVAWNWKPQIDNDDIVSFYESDKLFDVPNQEAIVETCKYGRGLNRKKALQYFSGIIDKKLIIGNTSDY